MPNIESTFAYVCRDRCIKAKDKAETIFEGHLATINKLPCFDQAMKADFDASVRVAVEYYNKKATGEEKDEILQSLMTALNEKFDARIRLNEKKTAEDLSVFLVKAFAPLEEKANNF